MCTEREKWYYVVCVCVHVDVRTQNNFFLFLNRERNIKNICMTLSLYTRCET